MKLSDIKNILTSPDNITHILEYINIPTEQLLKDYPTIIKELLNNTFQQNISNFTECKNKSQIENILTNCNKTVIISLTDIIERESQLKKLEIPRLNDVSQQINENVPQQINENVHPNVHPNVPKQINGTLPQEKTEQPKKESEWVTLHLFSDKCEFENGRYKFNYNIKNVSSMFLKSFKIKCNMYNVNESNNMFYILYNSKKYDFYIPFGYYSITNLTECMNQCIIRESFGCDIYYNNIKNRVYIESDENISIVFSENLNNLLGFSKKEYTNNNRYISERDPFTNIFDDLYIKMMVNDTCVFKTITNKESFKYYENIYLDLDKNFGKTLFNRFEDDYFNFPNPININFLTIQLHNIQKRLEYDFVITFEKT